MLTKPSRILVLASLALAGPVFSDPDPTAAAAPELPTPFTAEEIRAEMIEGFTAVLRTTTPAGEQIQRWTVVGWDPEGVEIEFATLGEDDAPVGETQTQRATWAELQAHARFDPASAGRERTTMETPLGTLDGWLYEVERDGALSRFFFADRYPGAPVVMTVERDGAEVLRMEQLERSRPEE